ncbi:MAG: spore germination protein [Eubacteriales bacterium]|nr:spore germination protein [Eubacteriales bacterium]
MANTIFEIKGYKQRQQGIDSLLNIQDTFDILKREVVIGNRNATFYMVDGFLKGETMEKVMEFLLGITPEDTPDTFDGFVKKCMPYGDIITITKEKDFVQYLLSGLTCLMIDGYSEILAIDLRDYPSRNVQEPDKDKVLRGSRDGFVESIMPNIALIRRRIRDVDLIFEMQNIGSSSRTDVSIVYMKNRVNQKALKKLKERMNGIRVDSLTMNQESLAEVLMPRNWWNPYPKFKYTERADTAAACILEGSIVVLVDNSPAAMVIPTSLFDIIEDPNDYYFPPVTGTYLRFTRMITAVLALFITPTYILLLQNPQWVPEWLDFILIRDEMNVPPLLQLLILELAIDGLRMAAVNTPNMLNTPLSVVAGIVFGDYTVQSGWFNAEIMLYMAFVAIATYTQNNMELGYAIKFQRIIMLVLTGIFGVWGFGAGCILTLFAFFTNRTMAGQGYLYPLIPFNGQQLFKRFFRISLTRNEKISSQGARGSR